jgi:hypothetical protein
VKRWEKSSFKCWSYCQCNWMGLMCQSEAGGGMADFNGLVYCLKPHCIRQCSRSYLKAASMHCWRQHHSVTASATYAMTLVTAWMPWQRNVDLLVPAGTSTRLDWIQCGFKWSGTSNVACGNGCFQAHLKFVGFF